MNEKMTDADKKHKRMQTKTEKHFSFRPFVALPFKSFSSDISYYLA